MTPNLATAGEPHRPAPALRTALLLEAVPLARGRGLHEHDEILTK